MSLAILDPNVAAHLDIVRPRVLHKTRNEITVVGGALGDIPQTIRKLLGEGDLNPKTAKNEVETMGLSLLPHKKAGFGNLCPHATTCVGPCLSEQGQGPMDNVRRPRAAKSLAWLLDHEWFLDKMHRELRSFRRRVIGIAGVRLNMLSDVLWEKFGVMDAHPDIDFYDYSANPNRFGWVRPNYWVTYSHKGLASDHEQVDRVIAAGCNVSVVFYDPAPGPKCGKAAHKQRLPVAWRGIPVIDGGKTDWRPDDPRGVIVGLRLLARTYAKRNHAIDAGFPVNLYGDDCDGIAA